MSPSDFSSKSALLASCPFFTNKSASPLFADVVIRNSERSVVISMTYFTLCPAGRDATLLGTPNSREVWSGIGGVVNAGVDGVVEEGVVDCGVVEGGVVEGGVVEGGIVEGGLVEDGVLCGWVALSETPSKRS